MKVIDGEKLSLSGVQRSDMGGYLCIASNGIPPSVSKRYDVQVNCKWPISVIEAEAQSIVSFWGKKFRKFEDVLNGKRYQSADYANCLVTLRIISLISLDWPEFQ